MSARIHMTSVAVCVCPSAHTGRPWLSISTNISTLVLGLSTLALPVDCSGDFRPRGLSIKYTQDVHGCPSAHTGRPCVSVSIHRTSVAVRLCPSAHTGRPWLSISTHISTLDTPRFEHRPAWVMDTSQGGDLVDQLDLTEVFSSVHVNSLSSMQPWMS